MAAMDNPNQFCTLDFRAEVSRRIYDPLDNRIDRCIVWSREIHRNLASPSRVQFESESANARESWVGSAEPSNGRCNLFRFVTILGFEVYIHRNQPIPQAKYRSAQLWMRR